LVWWCFKFVGLSLGLVLWYVLFGGFRLVFGWWGLLLGRAILVFNSVVVRALVAVKLLALTHPLSGTPCGAPYVKR
jgi:predicted PurR-regulated permease PerM